MKKWLIGIAIIFGITIGVIYLLIPDIITFRSTTSFKANSQGVFRHLLDDNSWANWLQENSGVTDKENSSNGHYYHGYKYIIGAKKTSSILINISNGNAEAITALNLLPISPDSTGLVWNGLMTTSYNPIERIQVYFRAQKLKKDINFLLEKMNLFLSDPENIYGFKIRETLVTDTTLVSTSATSENYPSTDLIYGLIDQLKNYIASQSARETGVPMLNITAMDSVKYLTRVAIPVDKKLKPSGNIAYRWMLGGGNIFVCEVKGGPYSIDKAIRQVQNYMSDHQRIAPAIPFQSLITDRRKEADTSKWVTKIYYPVI